MASSSFEAKYEVCFVPSDKDELLKLAFEAMDTNNLEPKWVTKDYCMKIEKKEAKLFIVDPFDGELFDHLESVGCRIVGPLCVLTCLKLGEVLPKRLYPVYSVSMRRITVTCSNVDKQTREGISKKVQLMSGNYSKDLTKSVTHLVVGEVGSKKYLVAANFGLPIMEPSWVDEVWNNGQYQQMHASDPSYNKYKCPIFKGLSITVSQISAEERGKVKSLIENNGGRYSGALKSRETTHLVLLEPHGDKYKFALSWKLHVVRLSWIYDSLKDGYCMDESLYQLDATEVSAPKKSTPKKNAVGKVLEDVNCSVINAVTVSHLDETTRSEISILPTKTNLFFDDLDAFDLQTLPKFEQFLDGCKIFLAGFNNGHLEKLRKIINAGGGMRFSKYSESVSHIVCGEKNSELLETVKASSVKPHVVTFHWLLECAKQKKFVEEAPYICSEFLSLSPQKESVKATDSSVKNNSTVLNNINMPADDFSEVLQQYIVEEKNNSEINADKKEREVQPNPAKDDNSEKKEIDADMDVVVIEEVKNAAEVFDEPMQEDFANNDNDHESSANSLFAGKIFVIIGFELKDAELLSNMIQSNAGVVVDSTSKRNKKIDIAVVPLIWSDLNIKAANIVTSCWLQKCIEEENFLPFDGNELFQPLDLNSCDQPLKGCVISISQYAGTERDCLMHLAEVLGAQCQEYFVRKANRSKGLLPNTHLILELPEGSKYEAARKWNIPAVTKYWLLDIVKFSVPMPPEKYLIDLKQPSEEASVKIAADTVSAVSVSSDAIVMNGIDKKIKISEQMEINGNYKETHYNKNINTVLENNRVQELINEDKALAPKRLKIGQDLDDDFAPKFNLSGIMRDLETSQDGTNTRSRKRNASLPLEEAFSYSLSVAVQNVQKKCENENGKFVSNMSKTSTNDKVLADVVLCVSKKLANIQLDLNRIVMSLGGSYLWTYDNSCTHYVFQGKANDLNKEFRLARSEGKKIVCPEWLYACKEANARIEEDIYPHIYKPRFSLSNQVSTSKASEITTSVDDFKAKISEKSTPINILKQNSEHNESEEEKERGSKFGCEEVNKQLEELIVAAKTVRADKRRSRKKSSSNPCSPADKIKSTERPENAFRSGYSALHAEQVSSEPSQGLPVTWDDPTERREREKVVTGEAKSSSVDRVSFSNNNFKKNDAVNHVLNGESRSHHEDFSCFDQLHEKTVKKFMFTSFSESDKQKYTSLIISLGGQVSESKTFDESATHLIVVQPLKNEKFLASVASGKWILHKSYLEECEAKQCFVPEEPYECGSENVMKLASTSSEKALFSCARRWRVKLQNDRNLSGAFHSWKIAIFTDTQKISSYSRILRAGGAEVLTVNSPGYPNTLTIAFVEIKKGCNISAEIQVLLSHNIKCLRPEYLAYFLIDDPQPLEEYFLVPGLNEIANSINVQCQKS